MGQSRFPKCDWTTQCLSSVPSSRKIPLPVPPQTGETISELVEALELLPLAITQVAAYIKQVEITAEHYLEMLKRGDDELTEFMQIEGLCDMRRANSHSMFRAWKVSIDQIRSSAKRASDIWCLQLSSTVRESQWAS
jgi:hypothetical protein